MKGALIHGGLLIIMLVYGYKEWTKEAAVSSTAGQVVLWNTSEADITKIELVTDTKTVLLEHRRDAAGAYWWGSETKTEKKPKPVPPPLPGAEPAAKPPAPEMEEVTSTREFPVSDTSIKLDKFTAARALSDLGKLSDADKDTYKLKDARTTLTVVTKGKTYTFAIGGPVFGVEAAATERYALDVDTGVGYVLSRELTSALATGEPSLRLTDPRGFEASKIKSVTLTTPDGKSRTATRITTDVEGKSVKTWGDQATGKPDQSLGNVVDSFATLRPTEYLPGLAIADLTPVLTVAYTDEASGKLGTLRLFKHASPGELPTDGTADPANPPMITEYYLVTEKTRVPGLLATGLAEGVANNATNLLSPGSVEPTRPTPTAVPVAPDVLPDPIKATPGVPPVKPPAPAVPAPH